MRNDLPSANDPLDALLREAEPHISDGGFTRRVLSALPNRKAPRPYRFAILLAASILSGAASLWLIYWIFTSPNWVSETYASVGPLTICSWLAIAVGITAAIWALRELTREDTYI